LGVGFERRLAVGFIIKALGCVTPPESFGAKKVRSAAAAGAGEPRAPHNPSATHTLISSYLLCIDLPTCCPRDK